MIFNKLVAVQDLHIVEVVLQSLQLLVIAEQLVAQLVLAVHHTDSMQNVYQEKNT